MIKLFENFELSDDYNWFLIVNDKISAGREYLSDTFDDLFDSMLLSSDKKVDWQNTVDNFLTSFGFGEPGDNLDDYNQNELDEFIQILTETWRLTDDKDRYRIIKKEDN